MEDSGRFSLAYREILPASYIINTIMLPVYQKAINEHACGILADMGCGSVPYYELYKEKVSETVCIDWPYCVHEQIHVDVFCDLNEPLPFHDNSFDTILLSDVIEHIYRPEALFREISRTLRKDGKLLLFAPFFYWLHEIPHDYHRYTEFALRRYAEDSGLQVIELMPYGGYFDVMLDLLNKMIFNRQVPALVFLNIVRPLLRLSF
jgi:SAM-dependent methyltransferase